jgi:hypothetical protein
MIASPSRTMRLGLFAFGVGGPQELYCAVDAQHPHRQFARMGVVGWILIAKGVLFLFGARFVIRELTAVHPVTFGHAARNGVGRLALRLRLVGFVMAVLGGALVWCQV